MTGVESQGLDWQEQLALDAVRAIEQTMWTIPAISIAAQAFLFAPALDPSTNALGRTLSAGAGLIAAVATMLALVRQAHRVEVHLFLLHRHRQERNVPSIRRLELLSGFEASSADARALARIERGEGLRGLAVKTFRLERAWLVVLVCFAAIDAFILVGAVLELAGLWHPFS